MQLLNTLYVTIPESYLHLDNDTLRIEVEHETRLRVPLHHLSAVVCFGHVMISPILMHRLPDEGKSLVLLDCHGRFKARLEGPVSGNVLLRRAQQHPGGGRRRPHRGALRATCVAGKAAQFSARCCCAAPAMQPRTKAERSPPGDARRPGPGRQPAGLAAGRPTWMGSCAAWKGKAQRGSTLRGSRTCWSRPSLRERLFAWTAAPAARRETGSTPCFSFLYAMWMNDCRSALEAAGLDPQVGFLHALRPGRAALALDLMEEFRPFADRLALSLVNRGQVRADDLVVREGGGVSLSPDARKAVVVAFQERKQEEVQHPVLAQSLALGLVPLVQARLMARAIRAETDVNGQVSGYLPFLVR
jgi:CRISPR-associated protein Cas1